MSQTKIIKIDKFQTIGENKKDLPNGTFRYIENVSVGNFDNSAKQVPNVTTLDNDQSILKLLRYGTATYGIGWNSADSDTQLFVYNTSTKVYDVLATSKVAGTLRKDPFFEVMDGVVYFDGGNNYICTYVLSSHTLTSNFHAFNGGMEGGCNWKGSLYGWSDSNNNGSNSYNAIYKITASDVVEMVSVPLTQTIVDLVPFGNYLAIICTASSVSNDGVSRMYIWDGVTTTSFTDIIDIGYGVVGGADILDGIIYAVIGFENKKGFRIKAYSGGIFQTVYTYFGRKNAVSTYLYCQPASLVKSYTGFLYFMIVGARPGSNYAQSYEMTLFRYGRRNINEQLGLSVYKDLAVTPTVGNYLGVYNNDFIISEEVNPAELTENVIYAVVYESTDKTRQVQTPYTSVYNAQPGVLETGIYTFGDTSTTKKLLSINVQNLPLPTGGQVVLKYKADAETDWTTIFTNLTENSVDYNGKNIEPTGAELPNFNEIAFRIETLGGVEITGIRIKAEEQYDIFG